MYFFNINFVSNLILCPCLYIYIHTHISVGLLSQSKPIIYREKILPKTLNSLISTCLENLLCTILRKFMIPMLKNYSSLYHIFIVLHASWKVVCFFCILFLLVCIWRIDSIFSIKLISRQLLEHKYSLLNTYFF